MNPDHIAILGDVATWLTALGTIGAFTVAFKQIHTERHERKRRYQNEADQAEKEQAQQISAWIEDGVVVISNRSHHAIHHVAIELADGKQIEKHTITPGKTTFKLEGKADDDHIKDFVFTDTKGHVRWRKVPGHPLEKIES